MSQAIRKFENGGQTTPTNVPQNNTPQKNLLTRGADKWDRDVIYKGLNDNLDTYLQNAGIGNSGRDVIMQYAPNFFEGIKNGSIKYNEDETFSSTDPNLNITSNGEDTKGFLGIGAVHDANYAYGELGRFLKSYLDNAPRYKDPTAVAKAKLNLNDIFSKGILDYFKGDVEGLKNWSLRSTPLDRAKVAKEVLAKMIPNIGEWANTYDLDSWGDTSNLSKALNELYNTHSIDKGVAIPSFLNMADKYGLSSITKFLNPSSEEGDDSTAADSTTPPKVVPTDADIAVAKAKEEEIAKQLSDQKLAAYNKTLNDEFLKYTSPYKIFQDASPIALDLRSSINDIKAYDKMYENGFKSNNDVLKSVLGNIDYIEGARYNARNRKYLRIALRKAINLDPKGTGAYLIKLENGSYALPDTFNDKTGTIYIFHPAVTNAKGVLNLPAMERISIQSSPILRQKIYNIFRKQYMATHKFQSGGKAGERMRISLGSTNPSGTLGRSAYDTMNEKFQQGQLANPTPVVNNNPNWSKEKQLKNSTTVSAGLSGEDKARIAATVIDLGSLGASFIPGAGTIASAVGSAGSDVLNTTADFSEAANNKLSWTNAFGNFAVNIGTDVASLIPYIGASAKMSKIARVVIKLVPRLIPMLSVYKNGDEIMGSIHKLTSGDFKNMNSSDIQNISFGLRLLMGIGKGAVNKHINKKFSKEYGYVNTTTSNKGRIILSDDQLSTLRKTEGLENQNKVLQGFSGKYSNTKGDTGNWADVSLDRTINGGRWGSTKEFLGLGPVQTHVTAPPKYDKGNRESLHKIGYEFSPKSNEGIWRKFHSINGTSWNPFFHINWGKNWGYKELSTPKKENGGIIVNDKIKEMFHEGGILKYDLGGSTKPLNISGVRYSSNYNPETSFGSRFYSIIGKGIEALKSGKLTYQQFNNAQAAIAKLHNRYLKGDFYNKGVSMPGENNDVYNHQLDIKNNFGYVNDAIGENAPYIFDSFDNKRTTGDWASKNWNTDNSFSGVTDLRRPLGKLSDWTAEQLKDITERFKQAGYDYYLNNEDKYYRIKPIETTLNTGNSNNGSSNLSPKEPLSPTKYTFTPRIDRILDTARAWAALEANRKLDYKSTPVLASPYEKTSLIIGDYPAIGDAYTKASRLLNTVNNNYTSDSASNLAGKLDTIDKINNYFGEANMKDSNTIMKHIENSINTMNDNIAVRTQIANDNLSRIGNIDEANAWRHSQKDSADFNQVIAPYMKEISDSYKSNYAMKQQLAHMADTTYNGLDYKNNYDRIQTSYQADLAALENKYKNLDKNSDAYAQEYKAIRDKATDSIKKLNEASKKEMIRSNDAIYGTSPFISINNIQVPKAYNYGVSTYKKGGTVDDETKEFNKNQKDIAKFNASETNKRTALYINANVQLSKEIASLIRKGLRNK